MLYSGNHFVFAVTGPSGSGKTTNTRKLINSLGNEVGHSITITTRKKRLGVDESEFFRFITKEEFAAKSKRGDFCCETTFCGNLYAFQKKDILKVFLEDKDIIVDSIFPIQQIKSIAKSVFVVFLDCNEEELSKRIKQRSPEIDNHEFQLRMQNARIQKQLRDQCDFVVDTSYNRQIESVFEEVFRFFMKCRSLVQQEE